MGRNYHRLIVALLGGGWKPLVATSLGLVAVFGTGVSSIDIIASALYKPIPGAMSSATSIYGLQAVLIVLPFLLIIYAYLNAALLASYNSIITSGHYSLMDYLQGGLRFFLRYCLFGILYVIPYLIIAGIILYIANDALSGSIPLDMIDMLRIAVQILVAMVFFVVIIPLHVLHTMKYSAKGFFSKRIFSLISYTLLIILLFIAGLAAFCLVFIFNINWIIDMNLPVILGIALILLLLEPYPLFILLLAGE